MLTEFNEYLCTTGFDATDFDANWEQAVRERHCYMIWKLQYMRRCRERSMFSEPTVCDDLQRAEALAAMAADYWTYCRATQRQAL